MLMWQSNFRRLTQIGLKIRAIRIRMGNLERTFLADATQDAAVNLNVMSKL
jgi:hypothetical protein